MEFGKSTLLLHMVSLEHPNRAELNCTASVHKAGQLTARLGHEVTECALFSHSSTLKNSHAVRLNRSQERTRFTEKGVRVR